MAKVITPFKHEQKDCFLKKNGDIYNTAMVHATIYHVKRFEKKRNTEIEEIQFVKLARLLSHRFAYSYQRRNMEDHGLKTAEDKKIPEDSRDKNTKGVSVLRFLSYSLVREYPALRLLV